jgi:hypothetical protein
MTDAPDEPLSPPRARAVLRSVLETGRVTFSSHALEEMTQDNIAQAEAIAVIRGGVIEPAEFERGSWRYRIRAADTYVVVTFRSEIWSVVVTAWRVK